MTKEQIENVADNLEYYTYKLNNYDNNIGRNVFSRKELIQIIKCCYNLLKEELTKGKVSSNKAYKALEEYSYVKKLK